MRLPFLKHRLKTRSEVAAEMRPRGLRPIFWPKLYGEPCEVEIGDALLWRRPGLISWAGRGEHSHAGMVGQLGPAKSCIEVREFIGGRQTFLLRQVYDYPGRIDVYSPKRLRLTDRINAVEYMARFVGEKYGWWSLFRAGLHHLPLVRWAIPGAVNDDLARLWPAYCSEALAESYRVGSGMDPVKRTPDCYTEPSDFARSTEFEYRGTLIPGWGLDYEREPVII